MRQDQLKNQLILLRSGCENFSQAKAPGRSAQNGAAALPPLNPLRAFEATARHGSLTKAAGELNVTHGAVSHQIRALEVRLKVRLFERAGQRLKLTPHGAELLPAVSTAFDGIAAATARMTRPSSSGALSVSCVPALLSLWIIPRLASFTAQYPEIRLTLNGSNDPLDIRSPDVDVCVLYGDGSWTDCWLKKWSDLELFPVVSPTLINSRPIRTIRDLADHVMLHADDGREWHTWLAAADALDLRAGAAAPHERRAADDGSRRAWPRRRAGRQGDGAKPARQRPVGDAVQPLGAAGRRLLRGLPQRAQASADRQGVHRLAVRRAAGERRPRRGGGDRPDQHPQAAFSKASAVGDPYLSSDRIGLPQAAGALTGPP